MTDRSASRIADLWVWLTGPWRRQNDHDELTVSMLARLNHLENRMDAMRPSDVVAGCRHIEGTDASGGPE